MLGRRGAVAIPASDPECGCSSRRRLLERALVAVGAVAAGFAIDEVAGTDAAARRSQKQDAGILNFFLLLEYLQEGLYAAASDAPHIRGELRTYARIAGEHERAHVRLLRHELGKRARPAPRLSFDGAVRSRRSFVKASVRLEEVATSAMIGEAANLTPPRILQAARIVAVDARHAAWIRDIARELPAPRAADPSRGGAAVQAFIRRSGYVVRG
jgi:hypothetical protein